MCRRELIRKIAKLICKASYDELVFIYTFLRR